MHIKCLSLSFELLPVFKEIIDFYKFGSCTNYQVQEVTDITDVHIKLDKSKIYDLSFDQSSTCTGIFIKDTKNTEAFIIEVKRTANMSADDYIFELEMFVNKITQGCTILHLIYERPIKTETFRSSQVAFQLEGIIRQWIRRYDQFKTAFLDNIEPTSWKASIVDKERFSSNYTSKEASKESIIELFPWTGFYGYSLNKDNDGYESIGIMFGWYLCSFDAFGRPYVRGEEFKGNIGCVVLPEVDVIELSKMMTDNNIENKWFVYNPKFSVFQNILKSADKYQVSLIQIEDLYTALCVCIEANIKYPSSGKVVLAVITPEHQSAASKRILGDTFHFYL